MMSNLLLLAQTQPATNPAVSPLAATINMALLFLGFFWLLVSASIIRRRKLYQLPPIPDPPAPARPAILLAVIGVAFATFMGVLSVYASAMHLDREALKTPAGTRQMILAQPFAQIAGAAVALILLANLRLLPQLFHWPAPPALGAGRARPIRSALATYLLVIPWVFLISAIAEQIARANGADPNAKHIVFTVWQGEPSGFTTVKLAAIASATIAAPIAEEIVFRGLLQRMLQSLTRRPYVAIVLTSLAFALVHEPWTLQPGVFVLALFLGLAYFRTGSLLVPILAHAIFNATNLTLFSLGGG